MWPPSEFSSPSSAGSAEASADQIDRALASATEGPLTVDITTVGRSSGELRRIEIWIVNIDGRLVIGGTPGARDWMANLRANPDFTLHLKNLHGGATADLAATATEVLDDATRREIWSHRSTAWYRDQTAFDDLVARAPTVELTLGTKTPGTATPWTTTP